MAARAKVESGVLQADHWAGLREQHALQAKHHSGLKHRLPMGAETVFEWWRRCGRLGYEEAPFRTATALKAMPIPRKRASARNTGPEKNFFSEY